jgi:hypothetical protein
MTGTQIRNLAYYVVCAVAGLATVTLPAVIPAKWQPYILGAISAAVWLKAHWNYQVNPDGTDARASYEPKK